MKKLLLALFFITYQASAHAACIKTRPEWVWGNAGHRGVFTFSNHSRIIVSCSLLTSHKFFWGYHGTICENEDITGQNFDDGSQYVCRVVRIIKP